MLNILHIFGAVLGAGGAYVSDAMFLRAVRDGRISSTEMGFLHLGSRFVWLGLVLLIVSGLGIFLEDPEFYWSLDKFRAKMSIVGLITANGIVFHTWHLPRLRRARGRDLATLPGVSRWRPFLLASGALSFVSWTSSLVLGAWRGVPYSYTQIMLVYGVVVVLAWLGALVLAPRHLLLSRQSK
jgi:hypothetical protein